MNDPKMHKGEDVPPLSELLPGLSTAVRALARAAKNVPDTSDIYYLNNIPQYRDLSDSLRSHAQCLVEAAAVNLIRPSSAVLKRHAHSTTSGSSDQDDSDDEAAFERLSSLLDDTYERLDTALDASKASVQAFKQGGWGTAQHIRQPLSSTARGLTGAAGATIAGKGRIIRHAAHMTRPQDSFRSRVDNSNTPWTPRSFPHIAAKLAATAAAAAATVAGTDCRAANTHPYASELSKLQYLPYQLHKAHVGEAKAADFPDLSATPCTLVETPEALAAMVTALQGVQQVAIDLEHHAYRSYQGFTCLMQLSTREHDWVVDTLALRDELGPALAALLADPSVEKVLHGSDNDILWLQRDFGLYIVNLFDTGQAARVLAYPSASLAYLLERHVGFNADKRYQLADWRLRPLPEDMLLYARADTHFLLVVSDRLKDELTALGDSVPPSWAVQMPAHSTAQGALGCVYERSRQLCLQVYQKPEMSSGAHLDAALRWNVALPSQNMAVFAALYSWRDKVARALDESVQFVMPKGSLLELSRAMPTTALDVQQLLAKNSRLTGGSSLVLSKAEEVAQTVAQAQQNFHLGPAQSKALASGAQQVAAAVSVSLEQTQPPPSIQVLKAVTVKSAQVKSASGVRGLFGGPHKVAVPQPMQQQVLKHEGRHQCPQDVPTAPGPQGAEQHQQTGATAIKTPAPPRVQTSSLGGLLSCKRPAAAMPRASKRFALGFLTLQDGHAAPDNSAAAPAAAGRDSLQASIEQISAPANTPAQSSVLDAGLPRRSAQDIRAVMDEMLSEQDVHGMTAQECNVAPVPAAPMHSTESSQQEQPGTANPPCRDELHDGDGDWHGHIPLAQQRPGRKRALLLEPNGAQNTKQRQLPHAEKGTDAGASTSPLGHTTQQQSQGVSTYKGCFADIGNETDEESSGSDGCYGKSLPSFKPTEITRKVPSAPTPLEDGSALATNTNARGKHTSRGRRAPFRRPGQVGGSNTLAAVRQRHGAGVQSTNLFEIASAPFAPPRRKGVSGGRSKSFK